MATKGGHIYVWLDVDGNVNQNIVTNGNVDYWQIALDNKPLSNTGKMIDNIIAMKTYKYTIDTRVIIPVHRADKTKGADYYQYGTIVERAKAENGNCYTVAFFGGANFTVPEKAIIRAGILDQLLYF